MQNAQCKMQNAKRPAEAFSMGRGTPGSWLAYAILHFAFFFPRLGFSS
jgi:hypothetical protein